MIFFHDFNLVLENDMLRKVDTMSMSKSLEVRTPFLDHELVEYVFSLPSSYKIDQKTEKILKETFYNELPKEVFSRKNMVLKSHLISGLKMNYYHLSKMIFLEIIKP